MRTVLASALVALSTLAVVVNAIPIASQQVLNDLQRTEGVVTQLEADVLQSNALAAQADFANIQHQLDDIGIYLGQITDATCVTDEPGPATVSVTTYTEVLQKLQILQLDMIEISGGVLNKETDVAVAAYTAAQATLDTTHQFVFGSPLSYEILAGIH
ncbi:hypothetical protein LTR62_005371 [Meristemomyces frigidus]|uniref:Uncharacterized protein n=1 Tax=Meristemomyces frigidus TaxID=1508187 RepID=A0AAN7YQU8_9PEZI|nr:hypothetical protein LTR62_005371 [Meristemomyces frigidus]